MVQGVVKASNRLKQPLKRRVPGVELMKECIKFTSKVKRVYLLGSKNEIAQAQHKYNRNILMLLLSIIMVY